MGDSQVKVDIVVVGAGVVGLSVAQALSKKYQVVVLEKNTRFGEETSSRNSEVIHSGIYYPQNSKKSELCLRGKELLYEFCKKNSVPFVKCGKLIVATDIAEQEKLNQLKYQATILGLACSEISQEKLKLKEPLIEAKSGLCIQDSGIIDSHVLMAKLEMLGSDQGALFAYGHKVQSVFKLAPGWIIESLTADQKPQQIETQWVVNCAGLAGADLANLAHNTSRFQHRFCRGRYLNLSRAFQHAFKSLVYPLPNDDGLGVHVTLDLAGMVRLGPDVDWAESHSYDQVTQLYQCDWDKVYEKFLKTVHRYFPSLKLKDLSAGTIGVRPKLFVDENPFKDFWIHQEHGWIDLLGIESPGLTACLSIAEAVSRLI